MCELFLENYVTPMCLNVLSERYAIRRRTACREFIQGKLLLITYNSDANAVSKNLIT